MEEKGTNPNLSTQKVLLPGHDPGWNDPPNWAYTCTQSSVTPTKRVLNKRVAFPLGPAQAIGKECSTSNSSNMPPSIKCLSSPTIAEHPSPLCPTNVNIKSNINEVEIDKEQALNEVLTSLETLLNEHILEMCKAEEVKKRLDIMKAVWLEDKLNSVIYKHMLDLSLALQERNIEKADEIHVALMMHHASLCSAWIPGIRHIILGLKTKMQSSNTIQR